MAKRGGRWSHVYKLWSKYLADPSFPQFDRWLSRELKGHKEFGKRDRQWYSEILFSSLRFGYWAGFCLFVAEKTGEKGAIEVEDLLKKYELEIPEFRDLLNLWKKSSDKKFFYFLVQRIAGQSPIDFMAEFPIDEIDDRTEKIHSFLKRKMESATDAKKQFVWNGIPLWFFPHFEKWGSGSVGFLKAQGVRPPIWIRVNHSAKLDAVINEFKANEYEIEPAGRKSPAAFRIRGVKSIFELETYKSGLFEIQDLASQKIGEAVACRPGQFVWDACAGGGGKSIQVASALENRGGLYASDIREYKLEELRLRVRRAAFHNIRTFVWKGDGAPPFEKEVDLRSGFHWVLVDAPCSASGTWRRNPDAKFRFPADAAEKFPELQLQLLEKSSLAVREKGHLVYGTCSWWVQENEAVIEKFLQRNAAFKLESMKRFGPPENESDSTFVAVLEKF